MKNLDVKTECETSFYICPTYISDCLLAFMFARLPARQYANYESHSVIKVLKSTNKFEN